MRDRGAATGAQYILHRMLPRGQLVAGSGNPSSLEGHVDVPKGRESGDLGQILSLVKDVYCHGFCEGSTISLSHVWVWVHGKDSVLKGKMSFQGRQACETPGAGVPIVSREQPVMEAM